MAYTQDQINAITDENRNLLVAAAAGSGKTQVMVERIIRLVCDKKVPVQNLMIVTFTNAAAAEMKERIENTLEKRLETDEDKNFIDKQIGMVSQSTIGTMHSFCIDVIRSNFDIVSVDPNFKMGVETTIDLIKNKVLENIFEDEYDNKNSNFLELIDLFGGRGDEKLKELILRIYREIQSQIDPIGWFKSNIKFYETNEIGFEESAIGKMLKNSIKDVILSAAEINSKALFFCKLDKGPISYEEALLADKAIVDNLLLFLDDDINTFNNILQKMSGKISFQRLKSVKKQDLESGFVDIAIQDKIKTLRDDFKKRLSDDLNMLFPSVSLSREIEKINLMSKPLQKLATLIEKFDLEYKKAKSADGILDFNDLEHLALKILDDDRICNRYKEKFEYIFFDEYQDSNLVQETIINKIKRESNLFFVGDVKQAIYRFRLSDPMLFNARYGKYSNEADPKSFKIDLSKNFRTNGKVLNVVNYFFKHLMTTSLGEVDYSDENVQLKAGIDFPSEDGGVEFDIINLPMSSKVDATEFDCFDDEIDYTSEHISNRIESLIGTKIYDGKKGITKKVEYRDIAVLLRSPKGSGSKIVKALNERNVPVFFDYAETDSTSVEVLTLCDYLKIIDNRFQDEPLLGSLTSVFGNFSMEDMVEIKLEFPNEKYFYQSIDLYRRTKDNDLSNKLNIFFDKISNLKTMETYEELVDFINRVIQENSYFTYLKTMKYGDQKVKNIEALLTRAKDFSKNGNKLFGFILYLDKIFKDKKDRIEPTPMDGENVVRVMSIHKSKGLEFPIVILADTKKKFNQQEYKEDIILHNKLGIGCNFIDTNLNIYNQTIAKAVIKEVKKKEALSEEVRILYVALTRAVNKLIIIGSTNRLEGSFKKAEKGRSLAALKKIDNYFDWLLAIFWEHKSTFDIKTDKGIDYIEDCIDQDDLALKINIVDLSEKHDKKLAPINTNTKDSLLSKVDEYIRSFKNIEELEIKVPIIDKSTKPLKQSVTEMVKKDKVDVKIKPQKRRLNKTPKFLQDSIEITPMEKGTIIHNVLEHIDLQKSYSMDELKEELNLMVKLEKITKEEKDLVDISSILSFLESEIGARIKTAKKIYKEESFMLKEEGVLIDGVIDCYFFDTNNHLVLIDYKTDRFVNEEKYIPQLNLYKKALENQYNRDVNDVYIYWITNKISTKINI